MKRAKVFVLVAVLLLATLSMVACSGTNFSISFNSNGGTECASISTNGKAVVQMPADPTKEGFIFDGWFWDNEVWQKPFTINSLLDTPLSDNLTVYARWKEAVHTHVYRDWTITTPATCTATGIRTKTCACGDTVTEVIPAIGGEHAYGTWTETETGVTRECTRCPQKEFVPYTAGLQFGYVNVKGIMVQMVTGLGAASGAVYIPKTHDGKTVGGIAQNAFQGCTSLTSVTIPSSVTSIGDWAFHSCRSLSTIIIPSSVISIGARAFQSCTSLASVTLPSSVTSIGDYVFYGCTSLAAINIPSSVTKIGGEAFNGCTSLAAINIPSSVTSIGGDAFNGCTSLASITADPANANYLSIEGNLYNKAGTTLIRYASGKTATSFSIPSSVTSIGDRAFRGCTSFASITIPSSVTSIGDGAFWGCTSLAAITIPSSVTSIGIEGNTYGVSGAFKGCTKLETVTFEAGSNVNSIGSYTFVYCTSLVAINIPSSVTSIGGDAFNGCTNLTTVTFAVGSTLTSIGDSAFGGCTALASITLPSSVTRIEKGAFRSCTALTNITIPSSVTSMAGNTFFGGVFNDCTKLATVTFEAGSTLASIADGAFRGCTALASITIPNSVTSIGGRAFNGCTALASITLPSSVTRIEENAFDGCISLASITIPSSVTSIGYYAFNGCTSLASITIPSSVASIENQAFYGCTALAAITIPSSVTSIGNQAFYGCTALTIYAEAKEKPTNWNSNLNDSNCPVYWFSATAPTGTPATGNGYWHYVGDVPTKWEKQ